MADLECTGGEITLSEIIEGVNDRVETGGGTMTGDLIVPHIIMGGYQLSPYSNKNILVNTSFRVNQREFDGIWAALALDEYGFDRWKKSTSGITQIIPDGYYTPSTIHTLSGDNVTTSQITSPSTGNWTIEVPENAGRIQLEEGNVQTAYDEPHLAVVLVQCRFFYEIKIWTEIESMVFDATTMLAIFSLSYSEKRVVPDITFVPGIGEGDTAGALMSARVVNSNTGTGSNPVISTDEDEAGKTRAFGTIQYAKNPSLTGNGNALIAREAYLVTTKTKIIIDAEIA